MVIQWNFDFNFVHDMCIYVFMTIFCQNLRTYFFLREEEKCEFVYLQNGCCDISRLDLSWNEAFAKVECCQVDLSLVAPL